MATRIYALQIRSFLAGFSEVLIAYKLNDR